MIDHFQLTYDGRKCPFLPGDTVLDCLERNSIPIAASCYDGICGVCTLRSEGPAVPSVAQGSLRSAQRSLGFFLACRCPARSDLVLVPRNRRAPLRGTVEEVRDKSSIVTLGVRTPTPFLARSGQAILLRAETIGRGRFPITGRSNEMSLQAAISPSHPQQSLWRGLQSGDEVLIEDWQGECFYSGASDEELLLLGSGESGSLALLGLLQTALLRRHTAAVRLYFEGIEAIEGPLQRWLTEICRAGLMLERVYSLADGLSGFSADRVHACGPRQFLRQVKKAAIAAGGTLESLQLQEMPRTPPHPARDPPAP